MSELPPRHAAVIGINEYGYGIAKLRSAVPDARAVTAALKKDHGYADPIELLDAEATLAGIVDLLDHKLPARVAADSGLVLYFAGHGVAYDDEQIPKGYLIPQDARSGDRKTWLSMDKVRKALEALECRHLLVVLDCCYAGSFRWASSRKIVVPSHPLYDSQYARFLRGRAWQVLTSASHDQLASDLSRNPRDQEGWRKKHSPFAAALIDGLKGKADSSRGEHGTDGVITATELCQYIFEELCPVGEEPVQTPGLWPLKPENTGEYLFLSPGRERNTRSDPPLNDANNPWLGPEAYGKGNAELLFGRERVTAELLERLADEKQPLLAVVGGAGSGKSSAVKAGLLPLLQAPPENRAQEVGAWWVVGVPPLGADPGKQLDDAEKRLAKAPKGHRKLLFIDPFEELFTQCRKVTAQNRFLKRLRELMTGRDPVRVLLTLRSDFESRAAQALGDLPARARYEVPAPTLEELREVVEGPAVVRALYLEPAELADELVDEVIRLPAALPLLSLALTETYRQARLRRRRTGATDRALTRQDYEATGGVEAMVQDLAKKAFKEAENRKLGPTARRVALRMVTFEGEKTSRRRILCRELEYADPGEKKRVEEVLSLLTKARLVVADREHLEFAHDALVQKWPQAAAEAQRLLRAVWQAATAWDEGGRAEGLLWDDDPRLPEARRGDLNRLEQEFVDASGLRKHREEDARRVALAGEWMSEDPTRAALLLLEVVNPDQAIGAISGMLEALGQPLAASVLGHGDILYSAVFSADGTKVLTASADGTARVWNADGAGEPVILSGHESWVGSAAFSADGTRIVTASGDGTARVWNVEGPERRPSGKPVVLRGHESHVYSAAFNADATQVVTVSLDATARVWNVDGTGKPVILPAEVGVDRAVFHPAGTKVLTPGSAARLRNADGSGRPVVFRGHEQWVNRAVFNAAGTKVLTASNDGTARVWNADGSGRPVVLRGHRGSVWGAAFNVAGTKIVTASADRTARVWNVDGTGEPVLLEGHGGELMSAVFNADGSRVVTASVDGTARVWNVDGSGEPRVLRGHRHRLVSAAFNAAGTQVVTASEDHTARVWNVDSREPMVLRGHEAGVQSAVFNTDCTKIVTASEDKTARVWNVGVRPTPAKPVILRHEAWVNRAVFNAAGTQVVTTSGDKLARVWKLDAPRRRTPSRPRILRGHQDLVESVAFNAAGTRVVTASWDKTARVWNANRSERPMILRHEDRVFGAVFNADGSQVVTASLDKTARVWNVGGPQRRSPGNPVVLRHQDTVWTAVFNAAGTKVLTGSEDKTARVWNVDVPEGRDPGKPVVLRSDEDVYTAAFNAAGTQIVTASHDGVVRVWNLDGPEGRPRGKPVALRGHAGEVKSAAFNAAGTKILTASMDGTARVWNVDGSGAPLVLRHGKERDRMSAAFNTDGTEVLTACGRTARLWTIDGAGLQAAIRAVTSAWLHPELRVQFLREVPVLAWKKYAEGEIRHRRSPQAWGFDPTDPESSEPFLSQLSEEERKRYEVLIRSLLPPMPLPEKQPFERREQDANGVSRSPIPTKRRKGAKDV